jgi:hypothetical protein
MLKCVVGMDVENKDPVRRAWERVIQRDISAEGSSGRWRRGWRRHRSFKRIS